MNKGDKILQTAWTHASSGWDKCNLPHNSQYEATFLICVENGAGNTGMTVVFGAQSVSQKVQDSDRSNWNVLD